MLRLLITILVLILAWPMGVQGDQPPATKSERLGPNIAQGKQPRTPIAVRNALQRYGWSLPLCVWPKRLDMRPRRPAFCVTASALLQMFPLERGLLTEILIDAATNAYEADRSGPATPEVVMDKITSTGWVVGCVPQGANQGVITLGAMRSDNFKAQLDGCASPSTEAEATFGLLVGASAHAPVVSIAANGQATYETYYEQCKQRQQMGSAGRSVMDGTPTQSEVEKAFEEAQKLQELADAKQKEADAAEAQAEQAREAEAAADKEATETFAKPDASDAEKAEAGEKANEARNTREGADLYASQKQAAADDAQAEADAAEQDAIDAYKDAELVEVLADAVLSSGPAAGVAALSKAHPLATGALVVELASKVAGALAGRYGFECMEGECGYSSCEAEARARAYQEEARARRSSAVCNFSATPLPDSERCYEQPGGLFAVSEVTAVEILRWACTKRQQVSDVQCEKILPPQVLDTLFNDPCNSPYGLCAPEVAPPGAPTRVSRSEALPRSRFREDPTIWRGRLRVDDSAASGR